MQCCGIVLIEFLQSVSLLEQMKVYFCCLSFALIFLRMAVKWHT